MPSQHDEDYVLQCILDVIRPPRTCIEIGVSIREDGEFECNTAALRARGWRCTWVDAKTRSCFVDNAFITPDNIDSTLDALHAPDDPGVMSIDIDGQDYWVWGATRRRPHILIVEYNASYAERVSVPLDPLFRWSGSDYFGASLLAMVQLSTDKGYKLVAQCADTNLFFVRDDLPALAPSGLAIPSRFPTDPRRPICVP